MKKFTILFLALVTASSFAGSKFISDHHYLYYIQGQREVYYGKVKFTTISNSPMVTFDKLAKVRAGNCNQVNNEEYIACTIKAYLNTDKSNRKSLVTTIIDRRAIFNQSQVIGFRENISK